MTVRQRFLRYRAAAPGFRVMRNRLGGRTIGVAVVIGPHCFSWVWRRP